MNNSFRHFLFFSTAGDVELKKKKKTRFFPTPQLQYGIAVRVLLSQASHACDQNPIFYLCYPKILKTVDRFLPRRGFFHHPLPGLFAYISFRIRKGVWNEPVRLRDSNSTKHILKSYHQAFLSSQWENIIWNILSLKKKYYSRIPDAK